MNKEQIRLVWVSIFALFLFPGCGIASKQGTEEVKPAETVQPEIHTSENVPEDGRLVYFVRNSDQGYFLKMFTPSIDTPEGVLWQTPSQIEVFDVNEQNHSAIAFTYKSENNTAELKQISLNTGLEKTLIEFETGYIGGAVFSEDGQKIAYTLMQETASTSTADLFIYDVQTGKSKLSVPFDVPILSIIRPIAWEGNNLIVQSSGGDAGASWGEMFRVDLKSDTKTKVNIPMRGTVSPDQTTLLSTFCPDAGGDEMAWPRECHTGEEIRVTNIADGATHTVYKNLTHDENEMKALVRTILAADWTKEGNIVFRNADGWYEVNPASKQLTQILSVSWFDPQTVGKSVVQILFADKEYVVWNQSGDTLSGAFVLNRSTGKVVALPGVDNNRVVISKVERFR